mgnify:CR=1 FL=1
MEKKAKNKKETTKIINNTATHNKGVAVLFNKNVIYLTLYIVINILDNNASLSSGVEPV